MIGMVADAEGDMIPAENRTLTVYQIWYETDIGPTFSTEQKAEEYLDESYGSRDDWVEVLEMTGYPDIREIVLDDTSKSLMDR